MLLPEWFDKADTAVKVAIIAAVASLATSVLHLFHSIIGTPLKFWLERRALRNRLATEYEYEQRKNLRELIGKYQGRMLEAAETLNHRLWNLYENQGRGWLDAHGKYTNCGYYLPSFVYRFLNFYALTRRFESEAILIDSCIAEKKDLDFVKFVKAFHWAICDVALFANTNYDDKYAVDHFFRDRIREICDSCMEGERFLRHEQLRSVLLNTPEFVVVFQFFDGLKKDEPRLRWDRLVTVHLLLLAFINSFGYDMQKSTPQQFSDVALQANNPQILRNYVAWLPKLGLQRNKPAKLIAKTVEAIRRKRDLSDIVGTWADDSAFDAALADQDKVLQLPDNDQSDSTTEKASS
jgi:hypothetical protein